MNLADNLARQRNRDAAERTLMAWIRTCLSLISFGFGLDKIIAAIDRAATSGDVQAQRGVQLVAAGFVTSARAMATRWRSPPESSEGRWCTRAPSPTSSSICCATAAASTRGWRRIQSGMATLSKALNSGSKWWN